MVVFAPAKINLGLHVMGRLPNGYHEIETLLYPIPWQDAVEVVLSERADSEDFTISQYGPTEVKGLPAKENLVYKAYALIAKDFELPKLDFHVLKTVPSQAGLGGGSSDAVAALMAVNQLCELKLSHDQLRVYASQIGSDCPFFVEAKPTLASGTGITLTPFELSLKGVHIAVLHPGVGMSTAEAYASITPKTAEMPLSEALARPKSEWREALINNFQVPVSQKLPQIQTLIDFLYEKGAWYAAMSGSGSAVFGLFDESPPFRSGDNPIPEVVHSFVGTLD